MFKRNLYLKDIPFDLKAVSNKAFALRVFIWITILTVGTYFAAGTSSIGIIMGILILGIGIAHGVELCHQALHNTGFTNSKINEYIGLAMGVPLLVSFYEYRISHLAHHKLVGTPEDTEYFDYGDAPYHPLLGGYD